MRPCAGAESLQHVASTLSAVCAVAAVKVPDMLTDTALLLLSSARPLLDGVQCAQAGGGGGQSGRGCLCTGCRGNKGRACGEGLVLLSSARPLLNGMQCTDVGGRKRQREAEVAYV